MNSSDKKILDTRHISLSEWYQASAIGDVEAFRIEDNEKRERLKILNKIIEVPFDMPTQFSAEDLAERTPEFMDFLSQRGNELCALRLIPTVEGLPKLRMRGLSVRDVVEDWYPAQKIDPSVYRADFMPHSDQSEWATIFIVNRNGIFGEMVHGGHDQITFGHYNENTERIQFSYDFKSWDITSGHSEALEHIKSVVQHLLVPETKKQEILKKELQSTFYNNYLGGYFETVSSTEFGLWFIDYNRIIGNQYAEAPLPTLQITSSNTLSGVVVYGSGVSSGIVVTIDNTAQNLPDINAIQNPILVVLYTTADYIPLMKQVVAIVTDEGGILSHASIIARELRVPCIIGTKFATQVLKDGDLVEVDADSGVVRIIK